MASGRRVPGGALPRSTRLDEPHDGFDTEKHQRQLGQPDRAGPAQPERDAGGDADARDDEARGEERERQRRSR